MIVHINAHLTSPSESPNIIISGLSGLTLISVMSLMSGWAEMDWLIWRSKHLLQPETLQFQMNSQWALLAKTIGSYTKLDILKEVSVGFFFVVHAIKVNLVQSCIQTPLTFIVWQKQLFSMSSFVFHWGKKWHTVWVNHDRIVFGDLSLKDQFTDVV